MKCPIMMKVAARGEGVSGLIKKFDTWRDRKLKRVQQDYPMRIKNEIYGSTPGMSYDSQNTLAKKTYGKSVQDLGPREVRDVWTRTSIDSGAKRKAENKVSEMFKDRLGSDAVELRGGYYYKAKSNDKVASLKSHLIVGGLSAIGGGVGVAALKNKQHKTLDVWDPDHPDYPRYLKSLRQADPDRHQLVTTGYRFKKGYGEEFIKKLRNR